MYDLSTLTPAEAEAVLRAAALRMTTIVDDFLADFEPRLTGYATQLLAQLRPLLAAWRVPGDEPSGKTRRYLPRMHAQRRHNRHRARGR